MDAAVGRLLAELEAFGKANDAQEGENILRMRNITRETGQFLAVLVNAMKARQILEIGTSNGYSTIWLASAAAQTGGTVQTIERADKKIQLAKENFERAGLAGRIRQHHGDAGELLPAFPAGEFELVFLDSERSLYTRWWPDIRRVLRPGGLLVADNAVSHPDQLRPLVSLIANDPQFAACLVPVGKGEYLATRLPG